MEAEELAALEHENMVESLAIAAANARGSLVRRVDGIALIATGLPVHLFNQVIVERNDASPEELGTSVGMIRALHAPFVVNLRVGVDDRFMALMDQLGLVPLSDEPWMPGMALHPIPLAVGSRPSPGHEIRRVTDMRGIEDHIRTAAAAFELPESVLRAVISPAMATLEGVVAYVGYMGGEPVTTGLGVRTGRVIGIYNIGTLPRARRRGYGAAITERIAADGRAGGCDVATLQSSAMGHSVYWRLGFRTVVQYVAFVEPESAPSPGIVFDSSGRQGQG